MSALYEMSRNNRFTWMSCTRLPDHAAAHEPGPFSAASSTSTSLTAWSIWWAKRRCFLGFLLRPIQNGLVQFYALAHGAGVGRVLVVGAVALSIAHVCTCPNGFERRQSPKGTIQSAHTMQTRNDDGFLRLILILLLVVAGGGGGRFACPYGSGSGSLAIRQICLGVTILDVVLGVHPGRRVCRCPPPATGDVPPEVRARRRRRQPETILEPHRFQPGPRPPGKSYFGKARRHPVLHRPRRHEHLAHRPDRDPDGVVGADLVERRRRARPRISRLAAAARHRHDRRLPGVRHHPLLRLLRADAGAALLPDRHLGRPGTAARGAQVLHLHAGRQRHHLPRPARGRGGLLPQDRRTR